MPTPPCAAATAALAEAKRAKAAAAIGSAACAAPGVGRCGAPDRAGGGSRQRRAGRLDVRRAGPLRQRRVHQGGAGRGRRAGPRRVRVGRPDPELSGDRGRVAVGRDRRDRQAQGPPRAPLGAGPHVAGPAGQASEVQGRGVPGSPRHGVRPGHRRPPRPTRGDGQADGHLQRAHRDARFGPRLQPPGAGPRPLPARPERRHDHQGRSRAAAAGERAHPGLRCRCAR